MRIVVRAHDARAARDAQTALAAAGVEATALAGEFRSAPDGQDVAILLANNELKQTAELAQRVLTQNNAPLATLIGVKSSSPPPSGAVDLAPLSGAIALDAPPKLLRRQIEAWLRVALAEEERTRRAATAASLNLAIPTPLESRKLKALYIGAPNAMFLALERAFSKHGGLVAAAFSSYTGFDHLHDEPFDAVVLNGAHDASTALSLCAALRRNASLYHLPTMVVTAPGDDATASAAIDRGAEAVAKASAPCGESLGWLFEAVRRERRRRAAEHDLRALRDRMGDTRTGLFQRAAFDLHLARLAADHHQTGRPLALSLLRVLPAHGARTPSEDVWKRGFSEIASLAARLMRETDAGATINESFIAVAMPATQLKGAKRTGERIASVAECTAFAADESGAGPLVFEQSAVELQPGESGSGMLARALRSLDTELSGVAEG